MISLYTCHAMQAVNECVQEFVEELEEQDPSQMSGEQTLLLEVLQQRIFGCAFAQTSRFLPACFTQPTASADAQSHAGQENQPPRPSGGASGPEASGGSGGAPSESTGGSLDSRWYTLGLTRAVWIDVIQEVPGASDLPEGSRERKVSGATSHLQSRLDSGGACAVKRRGSGYSCIALRQVTS